MSDQNPSQYGGPPPDPYGGPPPAPGSQPPGQGQFGAPSGQGQFGAPPGQGQFGPAGPPAAPYGAPAGPPAEPYGGPAPDSAPPKRGPGRKILVTIIGVVVAIAVALGVRAALGGGLDALFGDKTAEAKQGDCIGSLDAPKEGETTEASKAKVVDCGSTDAKFTVVGRIDSKTEAQATDVACAAFADAQYVYWSGERGKIGYILCLADKK